MSVFNKCYKISQKLKNYSFLLFPKDDLPRKDFYCGLIGCGHLARRTYSIALNKPDNPIVCSGLYSRSIRSAEIFKKRLRYKTKVFTSFDDLAKSGIEAIIIAVPNYLHYYYVMESLGKNLDVFCEKPVTNSLEHAVQLKIATDNSGRILMAGFNQRYLDRIRKLKSIIDSGEIGNIKEVHAFHNQNIEQHLRKSDWLNDVKRSGGGVLHNAGIHLINVMLYFFGKIEKVRCEFKNLKLPIIFGEDTAFCSFVFKSGILGSLKASFVNTVNSTYEHIIIKGEKGTIASDMKKNDIIISNSLQKIKNIFCLRESITDSFYNELVHFSECIANRKTPNTDINDFIETMEVVEASRISAIEKREVHVSELAKKHVAN